MKLDSQQVEQLAFEVWQLYCVAHGEIGNILMWRTLEREEQIAWINIAVFILTKLKELEKTLTEQPKKQKRKKPKKKK